MNGYDFFNFSREGLAELLASTFDLPPYRALQLYEWVYKRGVIDFDQMSNIARPLRDLFKATFEFPQARWVDRQISADGTRKYLFEIGNGDRVEAVMIKQPNRMTLCVSSQVGCGMGCKFCRTASMGFQRNLSASEIIRQVLGVMEDAKNFGDKFENIVFMGMGEPLHNFEGVTTALRILQDRQGLAIGPRKITVSSVGLVPAIKRFGQSGIEANLAISLNATSDEVRTSIMPINKRFDIADLLECLAQFPLKPRKLITIEYVMLAGINDTDSDLKRLPKLLKNLKVKINLIPYNENAGLGFKTPSLSKIQDWQRKLTSQGLNTTVRWSKGQDIDAACGQLVSNQPIRSKDTSRALEVIAV